MRPNWFLALPVDLGDAYPACLPPFDGVRRMHPADLHLTMAFLGGCGEERALAAFERARDCELAALSVRLGAVVPMGPPRRFTALAFELAVGAREIEAEIAARSPAWLAAAGARPERRAPKAHMTIARPPRGASEEERAAALEWARSIEAPAREPRVERLALYTWAEPRGERQFRIHSSRPLAAAG